MVGREADCGSLLNFWSPKDPQVRILYHPPIWIVTLWLVPITAWKAVHRKVSSSILQLSAKFQVHNEVFNANDISYSKNWTKEVATNRGR